MDPDRLGEKSDAIQQRLTFVLQAIKQASTQPTLLSEALEELSIMIEELHQQREELALTQQSLALEHQRYQDLFEFAPDGYLVTTMQGVIQEANQGPLHRKIFKEPLVFENGFIVPPKGSGLGVEFDEDVLKSHLVE